MAPSSAPSSGDAPPAAPSRREALRLLLAAGVGSAAGASLLLPGCGTPDAQPAAQATPSAAGDAAADSAASRPAPPEGAMRRRAIPSSGEALPVVGLGTWQQFDVGTSEAERAPLEAVLRQMVAWGGRVVDSSPMYGRAERVVGDLASQLGLADEIFAATKVWTRGEEAGIRQMNASMEKMQADPVDLMQVHNLTDWRTHLDTLQAWKAEGRVRYTGVTHFTTGAFDELANVIAEHDVDFVQLPYSIQTRAAEERLLPLAAETGTAVLVNRPYEGGSLFGAVGDAALPPWAQPFASTWGQFFLKFILGRPEVTCVIPGTSDPEHLRDNMQAGYGALPDDETRERMAAYVAQR